MFRLVSVLSQETIQSTDLGKSAELLILHVFRAKSGEKNKSPPVPSLHTAEDPDLHDARKKQKKNDARDSISEIRRHGIQCLMSFFLHMLKGTTYYEKPELIRDRDPTALHVGQRSQRSM